MPDLRAVGEDERPPEPEKVLSLTEAIDAGDVLAMLKAQRRLIGEAMAQAADNTRPQLSNELNKLHVLIRDEEARRKVEAEEEVAARGDDVSRKPFDASAV